MHTCAHRGETSADIELKTAKHATLCQNLYNSTSISFAQMFGQNAGLLGFNFKSAVESQVFQSIGILVL